MTEVYRSIESKSKVIKDTLVHGAKVQINWPKEALPEVGGNLNRDFEMTYTTDKDRRSKRRMVDAVIEVVEVESSRQATFTDSHPKPGAKRAKRQIYAVTSAGHRMKLSPPATRLQLMCSDPFDIMIYAGETE